MSVYDIAIIGGGMGGLALAAGLLKRGIDAHVFEAAPALRTATSTIISLSPNAMFALQELDKSLPDLVRDSGVALDQVRSFIRIPGQPLDVIDHPAFSLKVWCIMWEKMQEILSDKVPERYVHCGHRCCGYVEHPEDGNVEVLFLGKPSIRAKLVVGADGVRSVIRKQLVPKDNGPRYLGQMNWNALVQNNDELVSRFTSDVQLNNVWDAPAFWGSFSMHGYLVKAADGVLFWQIRKTFPQPSWTQGVGGGPGLGIQGTKQRVLDCLTEAGWEESMAAVESTPESDIYERAICDVMPLKRWSSESRRVVLLGDAAHAMHPAAGMGARTAFEDAHQLTEALVAHWPDEEAAVKQYEDARIQRCAIIQNYCSTIGSKLSHIAEAHGLALSQKSPEERLQIASGFAKWVADYPENLSGDPSMEWMEKLKLKLDEGTEDGEGVGEGGEKYESVDGELPAYMYPEGAGEEACSSA